MFNVFAWMIIIGALYGLVLLAYATFTDIMRIVKYIRGRRHHDQAQKQEVNNGQ